MWATFSQRFDWKPRAGSTIVYKPGMRVSVTRACGEAAIVAGKAKRSRTPTRAERDGYMRQAGGNAPAAFDAAEIE